VHYHFTDMTIFFYFDDHVRRRGSAVEDVLELSEMPFNVFANGG
jgi:hypothetical protein